MKKFLLVLLVLVLCIGSASATNYFYSPFNGLNSPTVGNGWVQPPGTTFSIFNNQLQINFSTTVGAGTAPTLNHTHLAPAIPSTFFFNFQITPKQTDKTLDIELMQGNLRCLDIRATPVGNFSYVNSGGFVKTAMLYSSGIQYNNSLEIWVTNRTFNWNINGVRRVTAGTFRDASCTLINKSRITLSTLNTKFDMDNYCLSSGNRCTTSGVTFFATDRYSGASVFPFTVTLGNGTTKTNSSGNTLFMNFTGVHTYTANVSSSSYLTLSGTVNTSSTSTVNLFFQPNNRISATFRNEENKSIIRKVQYEIQSSTIYGNFTTLNGTFTKTGLPNGLVIIKYTGLSNSTLVNPWNTRYYYLFIPVTNVSSANLTLYLANASRTDFYRPRVLDDNQQVIDDTYLQALRWYPQTNSYEAVEMSNIDIFGRARLDLFFFSVPYKFFVYKNGTLLYQTPSYEFIFDENPSAPIIVRNGSGFTSGCVGSNPIYGNVSFNNATGTFIFSYAATGGDLNSACLEVIRSRGLSQTRNITCSSSTVSSLLRGLNTSVSGSYYARGYAQTNDGIVCIVSTLGFDVKDTARTSWGAMGVFMLVMILIAIGSTLSGQPIFAVLGVIMALVGFGNGMLGLVSLPTIIAGTLAVMGIALIVVVRDR